MAVSYRLVIFLVAILVGSLFYAILGDAVSVIEPEVASAVDTTESEQGYTWISQLWAITPVFILIAAGAYLLKQGVVVR